MGLMEECVSRWGDPIGRWLPEWRGADREHVTLRALLNHSSGLTAWLPFYRDYIGRKEFLHAICSLPLEYEPGTQSVYSDLGFMLLGFVLEDASGYPIARQTARFLAPVTQAPLLFRPPLAMRRLIAPTEVDPWRGRQLVGEVHDENAWALGGEAGHSGLFGTAEAVGDFARAMLRAEWHGSADCDVAAARMFVTVSRASGLARARMGHVSRPRRAERSCRRGVRSHGFYGNLAVDRSGRALYAVLLTNRVNPAQNHKIQQVRPAFHDAVVERSVAALRFAGSAAGVHGLAAGSARGLAAGSARGLPALAARLGLLCPLAPIAPAR